MNVVKLVINKIKIRFMLLVFFLVVFIGGIGTISISKMADAGEGWSIGGSDYVRRPVPAHGSGATAWIIGSTFLLQPYPLKSYTDGIDMQKKMIKEFQANVPRYTEATVAIIPYPETKHLDDHNYNTITVIKRPSENSTAILALRDKEHLNSVLRMRDNISDDKNFSGFKNGVFYKDLTTMMEKNNLADIKDLQNVDFIMKQIKSSKKERIGQSKEVWSYITRLDGGKYHITERIDKYLHIKPIGIDNPNDLTKLSAKQIKEYRLRYIDFLLTVYCQCEDSVAAPYWEKAIDAFIKGISNQEFNPSNIAISQGYIARGENGNKYENVVGGCNDFLDMTIDTQSIYSLGNKVSAKTVKDSLEKKDSGLGYYNRLLESIRLSLVYQKKNHIKTNRTYTSAGLWGSNIASRIVRNKPIIKDTTVSYNTSRTWSDQNIIENIYLKNGFFGTSLVPAYIGPASVEPEFEASLTAWSTKSGFEYKNMVRIRQDESVLNDSPELTIKLRDKKNKKDWEQIFNTNKYYKIQVSFTRTPVSPSMLLKPQTYISKADKIDKDKLKSILLNGLDFYKWQDASIMPITISDSKPLTFKYKATVTIYYSSKSYDDKDMYKKEAVTNEAIMNYAKSKGIYYVSEPDAYSELKEGSIYHETFEAMAGVPTTRNLYFASGGSEFMVEVEAMLDENKKAERKYRAYFAGTDCEFKAGDTAPNQSLGGQSASLHGGGTYSKTWTGPIPNNGTSKTAKHTATSVAVPDYSAYNAAKTEANAFASEVNSTVLSHTSASDKKTRSYNNWGAKITGDSKNPPQSVTVSINCQYKAEVSHTDEDGNKVVDSAEVPCANEQATANPSGPGSYSITVTWTVPAHVICGPCCEHVLKPVEDTWTQTSSFDTLKITDVRVWKIDSSYVGGMQEITYDENPFVKATIKQGDPNIFYNIAATDTSQDGRLRYSLQQQQHDNVTWYETNSIGSETRSNKCDGLSGTLCTVNPIPVPKDQGHTNSWAKGILYNNTKYPNGKDYHKTASGTKTIVTDNSTDAIDKTTDEYIRFDTRRNQDNKMTVISDMLILQTSSGDQSVIYFETSQTQKAQVNYTDINVTMDQMWKNNSNSASSWKPDSINIGSYNGQYNHTQTKYKGTGNGAKIETAFDQDAMKVTSGDELKQARVVSSKNFVSGSNNKASPSDGQARMPRPDKELHIVIDNIKQNPINPNKEYFTDQSFVYYKSILSKTNAKDSTGIANMHEGDITTNDVGDYGYTIKSRYRVTDSKEGNVNSIVVQNPVSAEDARIVSLPQEMDQRTTIPEGSASDLLKKIEESEVCPLSPALCEYRNLHCTYYSEIVKSSFDFEKISTLALKEETGSDTSTDTNEPDSTSTEEDTYHQFVFDNFETNQYDIKALNNCTVSTSKERLVVKVTGKDATIELPVSFYTSDVVTANIYFGLAGSSKTSRMLWEGEKNNSSIETSIQPDAINQTMNFKLGTSDTWKQAGKLKKIKLQLDGDNTGSGVFIISKIEFLQEGSTGTEQASYTGSEDDKTMIRSLIKSSAGTTLDYDLPAGCSISENESNFDGFGTGRFLNMNGKRISMDLSQLGLSYEVSTCVKAEANLYIPGVSSKDRMIFSYDGLGFYVPAGQRYGVFTTGDGVEKVFLHDIVGTKVKLGAVFSNGNIDDCELYINDQKITNSVTKNASNKSITEDDIGSSIHIGTWTKNENYGTGFYVDNVTITKMPGSSTHTASCYTTYKEHSYTKQYTCNSKLDLNHVHNDSCTYIITQNNTHEHTADCFNVDMDSLKIAYDKAASGDTALLKSMLGDTLFTELDVGDASGKNKILSYNYSGGIQTLIAPTTSDYTFELYGSQGGGGSGGTGGYTKGTVKIAKGTTIYLYLGGMNGYNGGGYGAYSPGGGATDIRIGGSSLYDRILVAGGGGGSGPAAGGAGGGLTGGTGSQRCGSPGSGGSQTSGGYGGSNNGSSGYFGQGGSVTGGTGAGGGGGGYYGGGSGGNDSPSYQDNDDSGGGGGSGFIGGKAGYPVVNGITSTSTHTGNGTITVSWVAGKSFEDVQAFVQENKSRIPTTIGSRINSIFQCNGQFNKHVCDENCKHVKILNCNEPHHSGQHYDYDNDICWDACGNNNNHKSSAQTPVKDETGKSVKNGTFICLDNYFQVYFPNVGNFKGTGEYGIAQTTINRGMGYVNSMSTLEWTREKKVQFGFDVLFNRNGIWEQHMAGEWITVPIYDSSGREINYYDFYCILSNIEEIGTSVEFCVEAINCYPSPGQKEDPYLGDEDCNADCNFDNACVTNKERFSSFEAYHSAYRKTYTDVVGRIGNLIMEDTEDMRFSNLFKASTSSDKWIIEGVLHEVDTSISKNYLAWLNQDGSYGKDIRGVTVSKATQMYNTYGTQKWTNKANALPLPLEADRNSILSLKTEQLKPGYNILFDISTIGEYRNKVQAVPYFYALNTDTDTMTPIDLYIKMDGGYKPINYFGLMSEYVKSDNTYSDEYYKLKDKLYPYIMNLDWNKESLRRNYTMEEETITKYMGMNQRENVTDPSGNVLTSKFLTIPYGDNYALGTLQMLLPDTRARTFIGSSTVNAVNINGGTETNLSGYDAGCSFWNNGQRWHLKLGVPSSVVYVPYRNKNHLEPTQDITLSDGTKCKAYEEIEKGNYVIVMTADLKSIGDKYVLGYNQGINNGSIKVNGKTYSFGSDIPTVLAIYDAKNNASQDVDFIGTH